MLEHILELKLYEINKIMMRSRLELKKQYYTPDRCIMCRKINTVHRIQAFWEGHDFNTYHVCKPRGTDCLANFLFMWVLLGDAEFDEHL